MSQRKWGSCTAALDGARGTLRTAFAAPTDHAQALPTYPHAPLVVPGSQLRRIRDATERTCRASRAVTWPNVPSRGRSDHYSAPHETSTSALARRSTNLHTPGSSHWLSIIAPRGARPRRMHACFSGSICTTRSFFPPCAILRNAMAIEV